jgi:ABC-type molybdate transport system substrate-binding protein
MKPFNPEKNTIFKAPKYGGVTLALLSMFVLASMMVVWNKLTPENSSMPLRVLCGNALRLPVEHGASQFEKEMKVKIALDFAQAQIGQDGYDLYIPTERTVAKEGDHGSTAIPVAFQSLILATRKNFATNLSDLDQFFQEDLAYATCLTSSSSGNALKEGLATGKEWDRLISEGKATFSSSVEAAVALSSENSLDAVFIWDSVARQFGLRIHRLNELKNASETIRATIGKDTKNRAQALQFARFLAAPSKGQFYFAKHKFVGVKGDAWTKKPVLYVYCANKVKDRMLNKFERFEEHEHVSIDPHFLDQDKIPLAIGLIGQSNAKKSLPDLVFGSMGKEGEEPSGQFELFPETLDLNVLQIPVYKRKLTRFPSTAGRLLQFLQAREAANN